jgi:hypothetical protein
MKISTQVKQYLIYVRKLQYITPKAKLFLLTISKSSLEFYSIQYGVFSSKLESSVFFVKILSCFYIETHESFLDVISKWRKTVILKMISVAWSVF